MPAHCRCPARMMKDSFIGEALKPEGVSFSTGAMATGRPGLPRSFRWRKEDIPVLEVVEEWKDAGDCRHGSGERYVRRHWFRIRTTKQREMKIYFERQARSSGGSRWRLYSLRAIAA
jgi:hypothetical protein